MLTRTTGIGFSATTSLLFYYNQRCHLLLRTTGSGEKAVTGDIWFLLGPAVFFAAMAEFFVGTVMATRFSAGTTRGAATASTVC